MKRRILPLKDRMNYGFEYIGKEDPTWTLREELSEEEILARVQGILKDVD